MSTRNIRQYTKPYYNYTSEAYDYDLYPQQPVRTRKVLKKKKVKYVTSEKNIKWISAKFILAVSILFVFSFSLLGIQGKLIQAQLNISSLSKELNAINEDNRYLKTELSKNLDLKEVEELAINKIGMQYPTTDQIVYINVPKESYTVKNEDNSYKNESFLATLKDIFFN